MSLQYIALLALLVAAQSATAERGFFGFCPSYQDEADLIASTHQGTLLMEAYEGQTFNLVAWDPNNSESDNTCYELSIDGIDATIDYLNSGGSVSTSRHPYELVQGNVPYWSVDKDSSLTNNVMNLDGGGTARWNVVYMSETEIAFTVCTQFFFLSTETTYVYSLADLSDLSDDCIISTVEDVLGYTGTVTRVDRSSCP